LLWAFTLFVTFWSAFASVVLALNATTI